MACPVNTGNFHLKILNLITSIKPLLPSKTTFTGTRDLDVDISFLEGRGHHLTYYTYSTRYEAVL
jgi:hypothetical protein